MANFILKRSDMQLLDEKSLLVNTSATTKKILSEWSGSYTDLIAAIDKFNDDNEIPMNKRLTYNVTFPGGTITVLKTVKKGKLLICYATDNKYGQVNVKYNSKTNFIDTISQNISTFVVDPDKITCVSFGSYNPDDMNPIFDTMKPKASTESEFESNSIRTLLAKSYEELHALMAGGQLRLFIKKFNIIMGENGYRLNTYDYSYDPEAYNIYIKVWTDYLNIVSNIVNDYNSVEAEKHYNYVDTADELAELENDRKYQVTFVKSDVTGIYSDIIKTE